MHMALWLVKFLQQSARAVALARAVRDEVKYYLKSHGGLRPPSLVPEVISLDHDLGDDVLYGTGYDVITWIEENCACGKRYNIPEIRVHSANPVGVQNMLNGIKAINRMRG